MGLEQLFDANLQFQPGMQAIVSADGRVGELVGSGTGEVSGRISGALSWTLYEDVGEDFCQMSPGGLIETEDGATIPFDGKGYALRRSESEWATEMVLKFEATDARYEWLNSTVALVEGKFNTETGAGAWRVYGRSAA